MFPYLLLKIAEKKEYIDDFLNGKLYMKESGYFRKLEDGYRGDKYDGKAPINNSKVQFSIKNPTTGEKIVFGGTDGIQIDDVTIGFDGDDKVPIICMFLLDECTTDIIDGVITIKEEYLDELKKFGKYAGLIQYDELQYKIVNYRDEEKLLRLTMQKVQYVNLQSEYSFAEEMRNNKIDPYARFFKKDISYCKQNEFRVVAYTDSNVPLIDEKNDHFILDVGKFESGHFIEL